MVDWSPWTLINVHKWPHGFSTKTRKWTSICEDFFSHNLISFHYLWIAPYSKINWYQAPEKKWQGRHKQQVFRYDSVAFKSVSLHIAIKSKVTSRSGLLWSRFIWAQPFHPIFIRPQADLPFWLWPQDDNLLTKSPIIEMEGHVSFNGQSHLIEFQI